MNDKIVLISWNHKNTSLHFREQISIVKSELAQCIDFALQFKSIKEITILSTCNRIEYYALTDDTLELLSIIKKIYSIKLNKNIIWEKTSHVTYEDLDVFMHLILPLRYK